MGSTLKSLLMKCANKTTLNGYDVMFNVIVYLHDLFTLKFNDFIGFLEILMK